MTFAHRHKSPASTVVAALGSALLLLMGSGCSGSKAPASQDATTAPAADAANTAAAADAAGAVPTLADPAATAKELLTDFLNKEVNGESVADLLAPNFLIQRADGSGANREDYLADQAKPSAYTFGDTMIASQSGHTLSVRWSMKVNEVIDGVATDNANAPRLTTFEWTGGAWKMVSYAHFNPPPR